MIKRFSISHLERLSNIRKHTIRTWEKRYGFLAPERTTGNARFYSIEELERLLYLALLKHQGNKISYLSKLTVTELNNLAIKFESDSITIQRYLYQLIISLYKLDIDSFENILDESFKKIGYDLTLRNLIIPFLYRTDILSYKYSTADIHFAVTAIRKKLMTAIDQVKPEILNNKKAVLYLPKGEHYDLVLLYIYYYLKCKGYTVYYLGTNITDENLKLVIENKKPDELFVYSYEPGKEHFENIINYLNSTLPDSIFTIVTPEVSVKIETNRVKFAQLLDFQC